MPVTSTDSTQELALGYQVIAGTLLWLYDDDLFSSYKNDFIMLM